MAAPQTQFEIDGEWTPVADEGAFWGQVAADTDLTMSTAGLSAQGLPIYRLDLGAGASQTIMITSLIHANEPATRDAVMAWLRDLAYSTDPAVTAYLAAHRIVLLTPCNPDVPTRLQSQGININRDFYLLNAPETRVIVDTTAAVDPHMIFDIHEYFGQSETAPDWMYRAGGHPITRPEVHDLEAACVASGKTVIEGLGYSAEEYRTYHTMRAGRSTLAGPMHTVGVLSETNMSHPAPLRVLVQKQILEVFREWHSNNAAACTQARDASIAQAISYVGPLPLYTHEYIGRDLDPEIVDLAGYQLAAGESMPSTHAAFGVEVDAAGFVDLRQPAHWVIPTLLDPTSLDKVAIASRVERRIPAPTTPLAGYRVHAEGAVRDVVGMRFHDGARVRDIVLP